VSSSFGDGKAGITGESHPAKPAGDDDATITKLDSLRDAKRPEMSAALQ
jgi:hypothetical protein